MTKRASSPPTQDKGVPTASPPPPAWRHWLWLVAAALFVLLFFFLPATQPKSAVSLDFSAFMHDVSAHKVKTVTIERSGTATGALTDGSDYTTVIPPQAGEAFLSNLESQGVKIS